MKIPRRKFLAATATAAFSLSASVIHKSEAFPAPDKLPERFDPWIQIDADALNFNVNALSRLAGGRPIFAVVKNNSYGLGIETVPSLIENHPGIRSFGVVKSEECYRLLKAGIKKPVMLLALPDNESVEYDLVRQGIQLSVFTPDIQNRLESISKRLQRKIKVHAYIDTGMNRVGMPYHKAKAWLSNLAGSASIQVISTFTDLSEDPDFDIEQVNRLQTLANSVRSSGLSVGKLHAASSNAVYHAPQTHLDIVRPGISLFGAYPTFDEQEKSIALLKTGFRLRARVVRVEELRTGDSVSYGRKFIAAEPTWIATLPVGHTDGYPRGAVNGARILIGGETYPVIGAVSASHCIVNLGSERKVNPGDVATLIGPDHSAIEPNYLANVSGNSVYDILMHLNPNLPNFKSS
jgi:alanine racemase